MHFDSQLASVHNHLVAAAALGDDRTQEIAGRLSTTAASAVRLALLDAVTTATGEISAALLAAGHPGVTLHLDGDDVVFDLAEALIPEPIDDDDATARISLRLSESLKVAIDAAAADQGVSVNTWLLRAAKHALAPRRSARPGHGSRVTGWVTG